MDNRISGHTGLLALIGSPVGHSGSPAMYNYSFARLGLDYVYVAFDIKEDQTKDAIAAMKTFKMRGMNVTMPCKTAACQYMDRLSPAAQIIGAVNTIVNDDGVLTGHMTDGEGFVRNLSDAAKHEHRQNIKLAIPVAFFDDLQLVPVFSSYLAAEHPLLSPTSRDRFLSCPLFLVQLICGIYPVRAGQSIRKKFLNSSKFYSLFNSRFPFV